MIWTDVGPDAVFYRCITPKWAHAPTSGAGAATAGARFNRPGIEALYLAGTIETAVAEYRQGSSLMQPATVVAFHVSLDVVADFSRGYDPSVWPQNWQNWSTNWRRIARIEKNEPPTWQLADAVIASGASGLLYPSLQNPAGINLVVYTANLAADDRIVAHDPDGRLPRDQTSWS